ncbi:MAG: 3-hydroxyisobutyrate dehydrogenase [Ectothiorhodospiraceae bacterium]|nr:3-hydroxyisobutyrate dehydrogenase [Ectothiorhodospiraceae bacterium]
MARIGFIGLGNMGGPMSRNLVRAGHTVKGFDLSDEAMRFAIQAGVQRAATAADAAREVEVVVTMLPVGSDVRAVLLGSGVVEATAPGTVLIDCSTIDVETAQAMHRAATEIGRFMLDAPVSGGTKGADAGTLTFMCGGDPAVFERAAPILRGMGRNVVLCGGPGMGQVTKICNNMIAGITILAAAEALTLGERLGVDRQTLYDVISTSTGRSYIFNEACPIPGPVPGAPASNDYRPGFAAKLMLKDLRLAQAAAATGGASTPLGATAAAAYAMHVNNGFGELDSASIIKLVNPDI